MHFELEFDQEVNPDVKPEVLNVTITETSPKSEEFSVKVSKIEQKTDVCDRHAVRCCNGLSCGSR